ncbi:MAG: AI-2E family transporter [Thermoanaerobaculia bacterium]|nr:AI-2E family transporter [Thermoanaerobaculia bacterium]
MTDDGSPDQQPSALAPDATPQPTSPTFRDGGTAGVRTGLLATLVVLAGLYFVQWAQVVAFPLVLSLLLAQLLRSPVAWLEKRHIPREIGATFAVLLLVGGGLTAAIELREPAAGWLARAPKTLSRLEHQLRDVRRPVEEVSRAARQVQQITDIDGGKQGSEVKVRPPSDSLLVVVRSFAATTVLVVFLLLLILLYGEDLLDRCLSNLATDSQRTRARSIAQQIERETSRYLLTITVINLTLGGLVGLSLYLIGVPSPWLWGVMAAFLNFVPYLGAAAGVTIVGAASLISLEPLSTALMAPAAYAFLTVLEGMVITPVVVGRRFAMNPLIVFSWLLLWGWLWGIPGALIAIPLLTILKILADHLKPLRILAVILGRGPAAR